MQYMKTYDIEFVNPTMTTWTLLRQTWIALNRVTETKLAKAGLTPEKLAVLWAARDYPFELTPAELARLLFRENQTVAGLLNRMVAEGLIRRTPKRKGRPYTQIKITYRGRQLCDSGVKIFAGLVQECSDDLSPGQRQQLHKSLRAMRDRMLDKIHVELEERPKGYPPGEPIPLIW